MSRSPSPILFQHKPLQRLNRGANTPNMQRNHNGTGSSRGVSRLNLQLHSIGANRSVSIPKRDVRIGFALGPNGQRIDIIESSEIIAPNGQTEIMPSLEKMKSNGQKVPLNNDRKPIPLSFPPQENGLSFPIHARNRQIDTSSHSIN